MDRAEHLAWCKKRALEYVERGDCLEAVTSMCSDIQKHDDTRMAGGVLGGLMMVAMRDSHDASKIRKWIEGFN